MNTSTAPKVQYTYTEMSGGANNVAVKNSSGPTLETYTYDGLDRRITNTVGSTTTNFYNSTAGQVLEESSGGMYTTRYTWSPVYVNAMIMRETDTSGTGLTATGTSYQRLWVMQDANWNVTGLVNDSGVVVERYVYDPYGVVTVLDASYGSRSASSYGWLYGFQGMLLDTVSGWSATTGGRWYISSLGIWNGPDPLRFAGGDVNLDRFVGNNPTHGTDPSGKSLYLTANDAAIWQQKFGQYVNLVPDKNGLFRVDILPAGRQGNAFYAAAANYFQSLGIVGEGDVVAQSLATLFDGGIVAADPNFNHAEGDRVLVRPPGDNGRRNESYRLFPPWAFGAGPLPPPLPPRGPGKGAHQLLFELMWDFIGRPAFNPRPAAVGYIDIRTTPFPALPVNVGVKIGDGPPN